MQAPDVFVRKNRYPRVFSDLAKRPILVHSDAHLASLCAKHGCTSLHLQNTQDIAKGHRTGSFVYDKLQKRVVPLTERTDN